MSFTISLSKSEEKLIREYAKDKSISVTRLFRNSVLEKIEDDIDLKIYDYEMEAHKINDTSISYDEMMKEINNRLTS